MQKQKQKQIDELFIVRAIAIFSVVFFHSIGEFFVRLTPDSTWYPLYLAAHTIAKFGTPTFIMLSSFVLFLSYYHKPWNIKRIGQFYKRRLMYIIIPFILISAVYFGFKAYYYIDYPSYKAALFEFLHQLWTGTANGHLYFVFISVQLYILFPILLALMKTFKTLARLSIFIGFALQWSFVIYTEVKQVPWHEFPITNGSIALSYFSFYFLGAFMGIYYDKIEKFILITKSYFKHHAVGFISFWCLAFISMGVNVIVEYGVNVHQWQIQYYALWSLFMWNVRSILTAIVVMQLSYWLYRKLPVFVVNGLIHLGVVSFGVYLIHPLVNFLYVDNIGISGHPLGFHLSAMAMIAAALFLSWMVVGMAMRYIRGSWVLFGAFPKRVPYVAKRDKQAEDSKSVSM
ncbi:acyltransferase [Longirhabdus pacifica]|uniref:acyltransferase n=1 Tax=Longirhabdus pacifica TaxID=2305227 RepID=UPI001008EA85|nr:acyltransferase [Longirhabdus pacifica]